MARKYFLAFLLPVIGVAVTVWTFRTVGGDNAIDGLRLLLNVATEVEGGKGFDNPLWAVMKAIVCAAFPAGGTIGIVYVLAATAVDDALEKAALNPRERPPRRSYVKAFLVVWTITLFLALIGYLFWALGDQLLPDNESWGETIGRILLVGLYGIVVLVPTVLVAIAGGFAIGGPLGVALALRRRRPQSNKVVR